MKSNSIAKPVDQIVSAIYAMDLDPIKLKLMDHVEGQGWSREKVELLELQYRRFLALSVMYPDKAIAPTKDIDKFWHGHILDTLKYAEDCQRVFGYFLHHFPYFGMRGKDDAENLAAAGKTMSALYLSEFGEMLEQAPAYCSRSADTGASAYCSASAVEASSYCSASTPAYCSASANAGQSAYCSASKPAYCSRAAVATSSAYCSATKPSYCSASEAESVTAYCSKTTGDVTSAYCSASSDPVQNVLNTHVRPTLESLNS